MTAEEFLYLEAELLDDRRLAEWFALLAEDIDYRVPTRVTRERAASGSEFSTASFHMLETWQSLKTRIARFESEYAWSEDPPSRTRRMVGNVRVVPDEGGELAVKSNVLLFRARYDATPQLLAGERRDVLRPSGGGLRLARRTVLLDHTLLPFENLAVFL